MATTAQKLLFGGLGAVPGSVTINGVVYDLKIDDLTGQPVMDDLTAQYVYAERSR